MAKETRQPSRLCRPQMKQILIIANAVTTADSMSGGDKNFLELGKIWQKKGHRIIVATNREGRKMCLKAGFKPYFILMPDISSSFFGVFLTYLFRCLTSFFILGKLPAQTGSKWIIFSSSHYLPDVLPALWLKLAAGRNLPAKWAVFINLLFDPPKEILRLQSSVGCSVNLPAAFLNWLGQEISLFLVKAKADKVFCINPIIRKILEKKGYPDDKLAPFAYGVDRQQIPRRSPPAGCEALFIGRFHPQKGIFDLPEIWEKVVRKIPRARLKVIGSGPTGITADLKKRIVKKGLSRRISLLGFLDGRRKFAQLKSTHLLLFPSYYGESFGLVNLEALSCGRPVVAYDLPPVKAIFPKGIFYIPLGKTKEFARKVVSLLTTGKKIYKKSAAEGYKFSKKFSWSKSAASVLRATIA